MKQFVLSLAAFAFVAFTLVSCGSKSDPKDVALNYLNALKKMDYDAAKKYGTPETGKMLDMLASFSGMVPDSVKNKAKDVKVSIKEAKEEGDKCVVTFSSDDKPEATETLNLVKKDGKWLVNMTKDDMGGGSPSEDASAPVEEAPVEGAVPAEGDSPAGKDSIKVDAPK